jgi:ATP-dependent DNA helicase RecG
MGCPPKPKIDYNDATEQIMVMGTPMSDYIDPTSLRSFDSRPLRGVPFSQIDLRKVVDHLTDATTSTRFVGPRDPITYLLDRGCAVKDGEELLPTSAGILCFGVNPQTIFPQAVTNIIRYSGGLPDSDEQIDRLRDIGGTLFEQIHRSLDFFRSNLRHGMILAPGGLQRIERDEISMKALRELLGNAYLHSKFDGATSGVRFQLFDRDRDPSRPGIPPGVLPRSIVLTNPGGLMGNLNIQDILEVHVPRNPAIFRVGVDARLSEAVGQGLRTAIRAMHDEDLEPPQFEEVAKEYFRVVLIGRPRNEFLGSDTFAGLTERQQAIIAFISTLPPEQDIPPKIIKERFTQVSTKSIERDLFRLVELGLLTVPATRGRGRTYRFTIRSRE